jgi:Fe2+ or Zn2+ uptake regulation protein
MNHLTEKERIEILMITGYGDRKRSHQEACPLFNETHPNRNPISKSTVTKTLKRFNETGSVTNRLKVGRPRICTNEDNSFNILLLLRYCYDLNFAVNRKGEKVRERSRTGSRTPTSGTGRDKFARGGENI